MDSSQEHYTVLGVRQDEDAEEIRHAFHELASRLRPARPGMPWESRYEETLEAFRVLSDPVARAVYDSERQDPELIDEEEEVLVAPTEPSPRELGVISLMRDFHAPADELGRMRERIQRNFTGVRVPKSEALQPLELEVVLPLEEARLGGVLTLRVPTFKTCPACGGSGDASLFPCFACQQEGLIEDEVPVQLLIPRGVGSGTEFQVPLHGLGIDNLYLRLRVRVD